MRSTKIKQQPQPDEEDGSEASSNDYQAEESLNLSDEVRGFNKSRASRMASKTSAVNSAISDEQKELLIRFVHETQCLWNPNNALYKNVTRKQAAWDSINETLNGSENPSDWTIDAKKEWKNLRDLFNKTRRRMTLAGIDVDAEDTPNPAWRFYPIMTFLIGVPPVYSNNRKRVGSFSNQSTSKSKFVRARTATPPTPIEFDDRESNTNMLDDYTASTSAAATPQHICMHPPYSPSREDAFGTLVATQLKLLPEDLKVTCMHSVQDVIQEYELHSLRRSHAAEKRNAVQNGTKHT